MAFKVYCKKCKHISHMGWLCKMQPNIIVEDNYFHRALVEKHLDASKRNANNDCQDFEEKTGWVKRLIRCIF